MATVQFTESPSARITVDDDPDSPWHTSITVNAGYYGEHVPNQIGWAMEFVKDRAMARRIVANQKVIDTVVATKSPTGRARVWIEFDGYVMTVSDYDYRRWTATVKAAG